MRLRFGTRTIGAAYLVVGAGSGVGAAFGGGAIAVTWGLTCGAMGVAWLARTDAEVGPDRIRLPRRGFRRREVLLADVARVAAAHPWAVDPVGRVETHDGRQVRLPGLARDDLAALALAAGTPFVVDPAPGAHAAP